MVDVQERLGEAEEFLAPHVVQPRQAYWLGNSDDQGQSFCRCCADRRVAETNAPLRVAQGLSPQSGVDAYGRTIEDDFDAHDTPGAIFRDGGWEAHQSENSVACEDCGRQLCYSLSDYGVEEEAEHFLRHGVTAVDPGDVYEIARMVSAVSYQGSSPSARDVLAVADAAVAWITAAGHV